MTLPPLAPRRGPPLLLAALLLAAAIPLSPSAAGAQQGEPEPPAEAGPQEPTDIESPYRWIGRALRAGPYVGWWSADRGVLEVGPGSTAVFGGRFRARISSPLSLEAGLGLGASERFVVDPRLEDGPAPVDTVSATWGRAEAAVQLAFTGARTWNSLQPYALFGGGLLLGIDDEQSPALEGDGTDGDTVSVADLRYELGTAPFFQAGLGVELIPSERLGVGFEVRDQLLRIRTPDGFFDQEILDRIEELDVPAPQRVEWTHHLEFTVTLWYYL